MALRDYLKPKPPRHGSAYTRVRDLIGSLESGIPDLAKRHRKYCVAVSCIRPHGARNAARSFSADC